jgi:exonuclease SbcD
LCLNEPAGSTGFCFVHAADIHLDSPFASMKLDSPEVAEAFASAARASLQAIARVCVQEGARFLVLSGDVFDSEQRSLRAQHELWAVLGGLAERGVHTYVAFGNHDSLSGWRSAFSWPEEVHFFGPEVCTYPVIVHGCEVAQVSGISYPQPSVGENLSLGFRKHPGDPFTVGVLHCNVGGDVRHANYAPCSLADLEASGIDYWALGHVHEPRILRAENPAIVYSGCAQGRNPREAGARGCFVVRVTGGGRVAMEFVPTDVIRWHVLDVRIDGMSTVDQAIDEIRDGVARLAMSSSMRSCAFRVRLLGRGPVHRELAMDGPDALLAAARDSSLPGDRFDWIDCVQDLTCPDVDREALKAGGSLISDLLCLADETRSDPARLEAVRGALEQRLGSRPARGLTRMVRELSDEETLQIIEKAESLALDLLLEEADS